MTRVFVSTWGQNDNIGDSVLRRGLVDAVRVPDAEMHVFVGSNDDGYLSALGLQPDDVLYRSRSAWWRAAVQRLLRERTWLIQTAGELVFEGAKPLSGWRTIAGVAAAKTRKGGGIQVGAGVRNPAGRVPATEKLARRPFSVLAWRDSPTQLAFGRGEVAPDWAFAEGTDPEALLPLGPARKNLVVTVRGDRAALKPETVDVLRSLAARLDLRVQVLTQVRRDEASARDLAEMFGPTAELILWGSESHADWEDTVRALYREALLVASDRAHALIIGATEGALPVGVSGTSIEKVTRIVAPAGFRLPAADDGISDYVDAAIASPTTVIDNIVDARAALSRVTSTIRARMTA